RPVVGQEAFFKWLEIKAALRGNVDHLVMLLMLLLLRFAEEVHLAGAGDFLKILPDLASGRRILELRIEERHQSDGTAMLPDPNVEPRLHFWQQLVVAADGDDQDV